MERKPNIILFTGPNTVFLERDLKAWKKIFVEKHGDINLLTTHSDTRDPSQTISECLTPGFMGGSRMILLHGLPVGSDALGDKQEKERNAQLEEKLLEHLDTIPETNFLVFVQSSPDKRKKFYKELLKVATVKEYPDPSTQDIYSFITNSLSIEPAAARSLLTKKSEDISSIHQEIQKLKLYKPDSPVVKGDVDQYVSEKLENRIFDVLDALLAGNTKQTLIQLQTLIENENVFIIFSSLLSNLRKIVYGLLLLQEGVPSAQVSSELGIHPFILQKNAHVGKKLDRVISTYRSLTDHEFSAKTGGIPGANEESLIRMIEAEVIKFGG